MRLTLSDVLQRSWLANSANSPLYHKLASRSSDVAATDTADPASSQQRMYPSHNQRRPPIFDTADLWIIPENYGDIGYPQYFDGSGYQTYEGMDLDQGTMFGTMIHKQWGTLLVGAAFARAVTYIIFYLAPPTSLLPGRPPSELITAFCLMAGGTIFMASARDCVIAMEARGLNGMFVFTVAMGLITFLMAWIILVIAIKGWAVKKKNGAFAYQSMA